MVMGMSLLYQCSPHAGKSVLHFFFDGVPETDSSQLTGMDTAIVSPDSGAYFQEVFASSDPEPYEHYPYEEQECASCHDELSLGTMVEPQPGLCYICHEDLAGTFNYLHGPVAGGYCTACHDPHRSENHFLLKLTGDALCFYCHNQERLWKTEMHQDLDGMLCMECHNPHGGDDKYIFQ
jgi:predicted CXXCH cytochrome family protein